MILLELYRAATRLGGPLVEVHLRRRMRRAKEDPARLGERLGRPGSARPAGPLLWLHAASLGESLSVLPLIETLLAGRAALQVLLTTGTVTSARLLAERLPARARHQFVPVDLPGAWRSFLAHWRPDLALLVEAEIWPNLVAESRAQGVPLALINGHMSERSHRRWARVPGAARALLDAFELCLAQSAADRARFAALGARDVRAIGNLKHEAPPLPADPGALAALRAALGDRPVWLAASTHPGEEEQIARVHGALARDVQGLLTILVPRHPERGDGLAAMLRGLGLQVAQRSRAERPEAGTAVYLADTLGELGLFYRIAKVAFIGRSLVPGGGHNPLEAARLGCPPIFGPHTENFKEIAQALQAQGAAREVADAGELARVLAELLSDAAALADLAARARVAAERERHALARTLDALAPLLERALGPARAGA